MKAVIKGTIVGGIIAFIWGAVSWMVLPWHMNTMEHFKSDSSIQTTILRNAPKSGVYVIPNPHEFKKDAEEAGDGKIKASPKERIVMFAAIDIDAKNPMSPMTYIYSFLTQLVVAFLITWIVKASDIRSYLGRLFAILGMVLMGSLMVYLPMWTWWHFPTMYIGVNIVDLLITWFLAGLTIAAFTKRPTQIVGLQ